MPVVTVAAGDQGPERGGGWLRRAIRSPSGSAVSPPEWTPNGLRLCCGRAWGRRCSVAARPAAAKRALGGGSIEMRLPQVQEQRQAERHADEENGDHRQPSPAQPESSALFAREHAHHHR